MDPQMAGALLDLGYLQAPTGTDWTTFALWETWGRCHGPGPSWGMASPGAQLRASRRETVPPPRSQPDSGRVTRPPSRCMEEAGRQVWRSRGEARLGRRVRGMPRL